jgi:hypothetical protein
VTTPQTAGILRDTAALVRAGIHADHDAMTLMIESYTDERERAELLSSMIGYAAAITCHYARLAGVTPEVAIALMQARADANG